MDLQKKSTDPKHVQDLQRIDRDNGVVPQKSNDVTFVPDGGPQSKQSPTASDNFYHYRNYDPYDYCTSKRPNTYWDAFFHLLKSVMGTGIFVMPSTFKDVGYAVGTAGVFCTTLFCTCCMHLLINSEYELCKRRRIPHMTYGDTVLSAFADAFPGCRCLAKTVKFAANLLFVFLEMGACSCYVIFMAGNVKQLAEHYFGYQFDLRLLMVYVAIPLILISWIRTLKSLAPFSAAADVTLILCFTGMMWYMFRETPSFEGKLPVGDLKKLPVFVSTVTFSLSSVGVVLPLKAEMSRPNQFGSGTGVLNAATVPVVLLYIITGAVGYLKYGDNVATSITLNLPRDEILAQCIKFFFSLPVIMSYTLCYYVVLDVLWTNFLKSKVRHNPFLWEYVTRAVISAATLLIAAAVPNIATLVSLLGGLSMGIDGLVLPVVVHTLVFWSSHKTSRRFYTFLLKNAAMFLVALFILCTGVALGVNDVILMYQK